MFRCLFVLLLLPVLWRCTPATEPTLAQPSFFDLTAYLETEIARLPGLGPVTKQTVINGVRETRQVSGLDYRTELAPFLSADINRPAWLDKYRVDSLVTNGALRRLSYTALDDDLFTRKLVIDFDGAAEVDSLYIEKASELMIADTRRQLTYRPASGYTLTGAQRVLLASDNSIAVRVDF